MEYVLTVQKKVQILEEGKEPVHVVELKQVSDAKKGEQFYAKMVLKSEAYTRTLFEALPDESQVLVTIKPYQGTMDKHLNPEEES